MAGSLKSLLGLLLATTSLMSQAIEEPSYELVRQLQGENIEIRQYAPYVVAEVLVEGPADKAGNQAFPILAGYIFGKNKGTQKFEMTAPVTQTAAPVKMEMTAPVTQTAATGGYRVQFVLPKSVSLASAPQPDDPQVQLREVPAKRIAAIRYSGFWSQANFEEHLGKLQVALRAANISWSGEPTLSRFNGPMTPWFLRRNEIWLELLPSP